MVPGVPCVDRGNWGQDLALCEYSVLRRLFLARIGPCTLMSHTKMSIVSEGVGPRIIVLESRSQVSKVHA